MTFLDLDEFQKWAVTVLIADMPDFPFNAPFSMELKINGVEVDPLKLLKRLQENYDESCKIEAASMMKEQFDYLLDKLREVSEDIEESGKRWLEKLEK